MEHIAGIAIGLLGSIAAVGILMIVLALLIGWHESRPRSPDRSRIPANSTVRAGVLFLCMAGIWILRILCNDMIPEEWLDHITPPIQLWQAWVTVIGLIGFGVVLLVVGRRAPKTERDRASDARDVDDATNS